MAFYVGLRDLSINFLKFELILTKCVFKPGVLSITILCPMAEASPWVMKREPESIVPPYLQSGAQEESCPPEV